MNRPLAPQALRDRATHYVVAIREAASAIPAVDSASGSLFDICRHAAETALGRAEIEADRVEKLKVLGDPADLLAAVLLQKKCADAPGFRERTAGASLRFVEALTALDPTLALWIAEIALQVRPAMFRESLP
jgi:hypothetical protein